MRTLIIGFLSFPFIFAATAHVGRYGDYYVQSDPQYYRSRFGMDPSMYYGGPGMALPTVMTADLGYRTPINFHRSSSFYPEYYRGFGNGIPLYGRSDGSFRQFDRFNPYRSGDFRPDYGLYQQYPTFPPFQKA